MKLIHNLFDRLRDVLLLSNMDASFYRIIEVNVAKHEVMFNVKNKAILVTYKFEDIINDYHLISNLSSLEACYLGGYFGREVRKSIEQKCIVNKFKSVQIQFKNKASRFQIVFQNRDGALGYIDQKSKAEFIAHPLEIANNKNILRNFDPVQACYIGILAGESFEKNKGNINPTVNIRERPKLKIVK